MVAGPSGGQPAPLRSIEEGRGVRDAVQASIFKVKFVGASNVSPSGAQELPCRLNFFLGSDSSRWASGVPCFKEIWYRGLYDGVDLVYRRVGNGVKYEFIVRPGAELSDIQLEFEGADLTARGDTLLIRTKAGTLADEGLAFFEERGDERRPVEGRMLVGRNILSYSAEYNSSSTLVIDPLIHSTYLGGALDDEGSSIKLDPSGNVYVAGITSSLDFPVTPGSFDVSWNGSDDIFVSKMSPDCSELIFSTYIGGKADDRCRALEVDSDGEIFLAGYTLSPDFPTSAGAFCRTFGPNSDGFVVKLSAGGSDIVFSTFIGGSSSDAVEAMALNESGEIYLTGQTNSPDFPSTPDAYKAKTHPYNDGFFSVLSLSGSSLIYSTIIGGGYPDDYPTSITVDSGGSIYICGATKDPGFDTTPDAYNRTFKGIADGFVLKLSPSMRTLDYSTFIGGDHWDWPTSVAVDSLGNAHVTGWTCSADFPVTPGAYDETYNCVNSSHRTRDSFIFKLNQTGSKLLYSTYVGGMGNDDTSNQIQLCNDGSVLICGETNSYDFPVTRDAYQSELEGGRDAFISRLSPDGSRLLHSTHLGSYCLANSIALQTLNRTYITGMTYTYDFPVTPGAYDTTFNNGTDAFVTALSLVPPPTPPKNLTAREGYSYVQLSWSPPDDPGERPVVNYSVHRGHRASNLTLYTVLGDVMEFNDTAVENGAVYYYAVAAFNSILWSELSRPVMIVPGAAPGPPLNLSAGSGGGFILLEWEPPIFDGGLSVTAYRIYRGEARTNLSRLVQVGNWSYRDNGVLHGVEYYYAVSAVNAKGEGPLSELASAHAARAPSPPRNLSARLDGRWVVLDWSPPLDDGASPLLSYRIYRQESSGAPALAAEVSSSELSWRDGPYESLNTIYYYATAVNAIGESVPTEPVRVDTGTYPGAPTHINITLGNRTVELKWQTPLSDGRARILHYNIYRGEAPDRKELLNSAGPGATGYTDDSVERGRVYYYCVSAVNAIGEGPFSDEVSISTDGQPPSLIVESPASGTYFNVTRARVWGRAEDDFGLGIVEFSLDGTSWTLCNGTSNWSVDHNLIEGENVIRIRALDIWGNENSTELRIMVDLEKPLIRIITPEGGAILKARDIEIKGRASDNMLLRAIELSMDGLNWSPASGLTEWSGRLELESGNNTIYARATDAAGNTNWSECICTVDLVPPRVTILRPMGRERYRSSGSPFFLEVCGTAEDDTGVVLVEYSLDGKEWAMAAGNESWSFRLGLEPGRHVVYVRATDRAGRTGYSEVSFSFDLVITISALWPVVLGIMGTVAAACIILFKRHHMRKHRS